jgi:hypothetical protein
MQISLEGYAPPIALEAGTDTRIRRIDAAR